ncbi:carotenoid oxygenase [Teratosphaeria nubilosa]|uniref:Carotenoid oxygenase n=1 Tax=Teratosphaeria nubilosa TaxID=161662 RepID=A0A6G1LMT0_9PEZI|nr:carotenoid oxygenase [Teratosphaeria nubilosa]
MLEATPFVVATQASTPQASTKRNRTSSSHELRPTPQPKHPYLSGNFAPIHQTLPLTPCSYSGRIPEELAGGEYVRNGSSPVSNEDLGRDAHWFDGDGMLAGVLFRRDTEDGDVKPEFVNQYVLTDLYLSTISSPHLKVPILPSIATLVNPLASVIYVTLRIIRTLMLVLLSFLPGSKQSIKKISVANTHILYHDGRALATCESGPPIRIQLPELETVGWYNGAWAEGEKSDEAAEEGQPDQKEKVLGEDGGLISFMREWTTAHPKVDPITKEMLMFHASFVPPYVQYSVIPRQEKGSEKMTAGPSRQKMLNAAVPGVRGGRMMHDFGVSLKNTIIMDLPLSLDPIMQLRGLPPVTYDSGKPSRFGVFPRHRPDLVHWFETDACCIFHTANSWDTVDAAGRTTNANMLACRLTSATVIFAAGNIAPPVERQKVIAVAEQKKRRMSFFSKYDHESEKSIFERSGLVESPSEEKEAFIKLSIDAAQAIDDKGPWDEEQCRLYYYDFDLTTGQIAHQWALAAVPLEFPSVAPELEMQNARYVYGCSTSTTNFGSALGKATKIDVLLKVDAHTLIQCGKRQPPRSVTGTVDTRNMDQVLASHDLEDPVRAFRMPEDWFAQEPRFVPAASRRSEDDGYLLFYAFDETQLDGYGDIPSDSSELRANSELWVVDARTMKDVVCRVHLPQRVPYGLHGSWFPEEQISGQRALEHVRTTAKATEGRENGLWMAIREWSERLLA